MKKAKKPIVQNKRQWIIVALLLLSFFILFAWQQFFIFRKYQNRKNAYIENQMASLNSRIEATNITLSLFSNYIFDHLINIERISLLMKQAWESSPEQRGVYREKLFSTLDNDYQLLEKYNFRQLHFHFPDTTSFLRVHSPELFGDKLAMVRPTVLKANQEFVQVIGFEEGRVFNGMRYVYPIFYDDTHCGSVEISFSMNTLLEVIGGESQCSKRFVMNRNIVETTVFKQYQDIYEPTEFSSLLLYDKKVKIFGNKEILSKNFKDIDPLIEKNQDFGIEIIQNNIRHLYLFKSLKNILDYPIAWIIYGFHDDGLHQIKKDFNQLSTSLCVIWFLLSIIIIRFAYDQRQLQFLSSIDALTGIANRKTLYDIAEIEISKAIRYGYPISLILFDVDHFKSFNDMYGHTKGDTILVETVKIVQNCIRKTDFIARWGGEEFILLLPHIDNKNAFSLAEKIRIAVSNTQISTYRQVTISLGVTSFVIDDTMESMFSRADKAMYKAKKLGRNCTVVG